MTILVHVEDDDGHVEVKNCLLFLDNNKHKDQTGCRKTNRKYKYS